MNRALNKSSIQRYRIVGRANFGFTIVELLIVIVVIGILASLALVAYSGIQTQAEAATLKSDLKNAQTQLEIDRVTEGSYPSSIKVEDGYRGLPLSGGASYEYSFNDSGNAYCLSVVSNRAGVPGFHILSTNGSIQEGVCEGHAGPVGSVGAGLTVSTIAGSTSGFLDGTGTSAQFSDIHGIAVDSLGNIYVADTWNDCIRKITPSGVVTTFAGLTRGFLDGTGTSARFYQMHDVAVDASGTLYVADYANHRIRKVTSAGVVTTLAGSTFGFADGTGVNARFNGPSGVAVDASGVLYVADMGNNRIRKVTQSGVVTTLAGSTRGYLDGAGTSAQFDWPTGVAIDNSGNAYVADRGNSLIRKITPTGVVTTLAGSAPGFADGTGASAQFAYPAGISVDTSGTLYVADTNNHRIRKVTQSGVVTTLAGSTQGSADGVGVNALFSVPWGVAVDSSGTIFVTDTGNSRIRKVE